MRTKSPKNIDSVCKWGGSSLASGSLAKNVASYIKDNDIKVVIFSAPGKRNKDDIKVTDLLASIKSYSKDNNQKAIDDTFLILQDRYKEIASALNVKINIEKTLQKIKTEYQKTSDNSYLLSRGEWLMSKIMAKHLGFHFADAKNIIVFDKNGKLKSKTYENIRAVTKKYRSVVLPGFYGGYKSKVKIFSRGGSDITGAIVAKALNKNYINFTDIDGVYSTYPITKNSKKLKSISYSNIKFLGLFGFSVLHHKCSDILGDTGLKTTIKSTFEPQECGTTVKSHCDRIFASTSINALLVRHKSDIYKNLTSKKIFVLLNYKFLDSYFYLVPMSEKQALNNLNLDSVKVLVNARVSKKNPRGYLPLGDNRYIKIEVLSDKS